MRTKLMVALVVIAPFTSLAQADVTLEYSLSVGNETAVTKKISIARFFARVDSSDRPDEYLLFQAGKFFPLYRVNVAGGAYELLTPRVKPTLRTGVKEANAAAPRGEAGDKANPSTSQDKEANAADTEQLTAATSAPKDSLDVPVFKPLRKMDEVVGIRCRMVLEMANEKPVVEHCMANTAGLGITEREARTLARLFVMAKKKGYGWVGTATKDEDFVSVRSKTTDQTSSLELVSVSTKALTPGYLRIPREYKENKAASTATPDAAPKQAAGSANDTMQNQE